jgi:tripartite-type tricarboxylate transporter receptor subunit TctC
MSTAIAQVARLPETIAQRNAAGSDSVGSTPEEFSTFLEAERVQLTAVINKIGLSLE